MLSLDRKKKIIEAATNSFSMFGYKATTMDQVSKIANVGKGTIYTYFTNKEELFDEILQRLLDEMKQVADKAIDSNASLFANLHSVLYGVLAFRKEHQLTIKLSQEVMELGTHEAVQALKKVEETILSYIRHYIEVLLQKGKIKECDPELTAFVMLKLYIALVFDWERNHEALSEEKIAEMFKLYLLKGLALD